MAPRRLLFVDDEPDLLRLVSAPLARAGFATTSCRSLPEALGALRAGSFDAAVVDLYLGTLPLGFDLLVAIRNDPRTAALPVVSMSAADDEALRRCLAFGADVILGKPFTSSELLAALDRAVIRRGTC